MRVRYPDGTLRTSARVTIRKTAAMGISEGMLYQILQDRDAVRWATTEEIDEWAAGRAEGERCGTWRGLAEGVGGEGAPGAVRFRHGVDG